MSNRRFRHIDNQRIHRRFILLLFRLAAETVKNWLILYCLFMMNAKAGERGDLVHQAVISRTHPLYALFGVPLPECVTVRSLVLRSPQSRTNQSYSLSYIELQ